jgi:hypothetical protein
VARALARQLAADGCPRSIRLGCAGGSGPLCLGARRESRRSHGRRAPPRAAAARESRASTSAGGPPRWSGTPSTPAWGERPAGSGFARGGTPWGGRRRRPRHRPRQAQPEAQAAFPAEWEQLWAEWPGDGELLVGDAATVRRQLTWTAQGGVVNEVPAVPTGDDHPTGQVSGAVAPRTGRPHDHISPVLGQGAFARCLAHWLAYEPGTRLLVLHDRGEQPPGTPVEAGVQAAQGRLVLQAQPADLPELNPPSGAGNGCGASSLIITGVRPSKNTSQSSGRSSVTWQVCQIRCDHCAASTPRIL